MASEVLLDRLQTIAQQEHTSLVEVIRQGFELRALQPLARPRLVSAGRSEQQSHYTARRTDEVRFEPRSWRGADVYLCDTDFDHFPGITRLELKKGRAVGRVVGP